MASEYGPWLSHMESVEQVSGNNLVAWDWPGLSHEAADELSDAGQSSGCFSSEGVTGPEGSISSSQHCWQESWVLLRLLDKSLASPPPGLSRWLFVAWWLSLSRVTGGTERMGQEMTEMKAAASSRTWPSKWHAIPPTMVAQSQRVQCGRRGLQRVWILGRGAPGCHLEASYDLSQPPLGLQLPRNTHGHFVTCKKNQALYPFRWCFSTSTIFTSLFVVISILSRAWLSSVFESFYFILMVLLSRYFVAFSKFSLNKHMYLIMIYQTLC